MLLSFVSGGNVVVLLIIGLSVGGVFLLAKVLKCRYSGGTGVLSGGYINRALFVSVNTQG